MPICRGPQGLEKDTRGGGRGAGIKGVAWQLAAMARRAIKDVQDVRWKGKQKEVGVGASLELPNITVCQATARCRRC